MNKYIKLFLNNTFIIKLQFNGENLFLTLNVFLPSTGQCCCFDPAYSWFASAAPRY